jgi:hypothetical protein
MGFGTKTVSGNFEVLEFEEGCVTLRHCATQTEYTIEILEGASEQLLQEVPIGTFFLGSLEIEDVHRC